MYIEEPYRELCRSPFLLLLHPDQSPRRRSTVPNPCRHPTISHPRTPLRLLTAPAESLAKAASTTGLPAGDDDDGGWPRCFARLRLELSVDLPAVEGAGRPRHLAHRRLATRGHGLPPRPAAAARELRHRFSAAVFAGSPEGRESIGTAVSAASEVREGRVHVPPELAPNPHHAAAVQEKFLVDIKARTTRISRTFCQTSPAATHADGQGRPCRVCSRTCAQSPLMVALASSCSSGS